MCLEFANLFLEFRVEELNVCIVVGIYRHCGRMGMASKGLKQRLGGTYKDCSGRARLPFRRGDEKKHKEEEKKNKGE